MKKVDQKGFSAFEVILLIVVVGLVGAFGWYIYAQQNDKKAAITTQTNVTAEPVSQQSPAEYLEINELGVKIKTAGASKLSYKILTEEGRLPHGDEDQYDKVVVFSFKPEYVVDDSCSPGVNLYRLKTTPSSLEAIQKIGDFYYAFDGAPGNCSTETYGDPADDELKGEITPTLVVRNLEKL